MVKFEYPVAPRKDSSVPVKLRIVDGSSMAGSLVSKPVMRSWGTCQVRNILAPAHCIKDTTNTMKCHRKELWFNTPQRVGFIKITEDVEREIAQSGVREGMVLVNAMHITASVFINDNEPGLWNDFEQWLEKLAPHAPTSQYRHNNTGEDNADAHLKRTIMGRETVVAITEGKLDLGPWEEIFYGEFDGRRPKRVLIKIIGE